MSERVDELVHRAQNAHVPDPLERIACALETIALEQGAQTAIMRRMLTDQKRSNDMLERELTPPWERGDDGDD
jgi:hypothetical protein